MIDLIEASLSDGKTTRQLVRPINKKDAHEMILHKHYAGRLPSISYAFGYFEDGELKGVLTIGKPASPPLCVGVAGPKWSKSVYELNRLITVDTKVENALSYFVGQTLRQLSNTDLILVSYADQGVGHHGYIYQATNWLYTGKSQERTDKYTPDNKHSRHYDDAHNHLRKVRTPKHRYIFVPNRKLRRRFLADLKYQILPYPKGQNTNYQLGERMKTKVIDLRSGMTRYE